MKLLSLLVPQNDVNVHFPQYLTIIAGHGCNMANLGFPRSLYRCFVYICEIHDVGGLFQKKVCKANGFTSFYRKWGYLHLCNYL